jgi:glycosyltransferase involved in cell wall biosynthesis
MAKFSIILPVRNGGHYVKECVNSILQQDHREFELLVLDNQSTDGTAEWIASLNDNRIRIFPAERSLTIEENWGRITKVPKGEFITLIGHDDILFPHYLSTMNSLIAKHPNASLYQSHFTYIDADGKKIRDSLPMPEREDAAGFLDSYLSRRIDVMGTGFMMRAADYDRLGGIPSYPNLLFADFELWINLTRISYKATAAEQCFSFRLHQSTTTKSPDVRFQNSFERFIEYLATLTGTEAYNKIIQEKGPEYLLFYCRSLSHRLLRTSANKREGLTVKKFVTNCEGYARKLGFGDRFHPRSKGSIKAALVLDSNPVTRALFLLFKKLYPKPVMK